MARRPLHSRLALLRRRLVPTDSRHSRGSGRSGFLSRIDLLHHRGLPAVLRSEQRRRFRTLWLMVRAYGTGVSLASALVIVVFAMLLGGMASVPGGVGMASVPGGGRDSRGRPHHGACLGRSSRGHCLRFRHHVPSRYVPVPPNLGLLLTSLAATTRIRVASQPPGGERIRT